MKTLINDYPGQKDIDFGTVKTVEMTMDTFPDRRRRTIRVWLPEGYDGVRRYPVLYMHDGQNLFAGLDDRWKWYAEREMRKVPEEDQVIIVAVDTSGNRFEELCPPWPLSDWIKNRPYSSGMEPHGDWYRDFIIQQVKPFIDANFQTKPQREYTGIGGSSMGGIESLYMFLSRPDIFGRALCFSTATGVAEMDWIIGQLDQSYDKIREDRLYLFNGGQTADSGNIRPTLEIYEHLARKGMDYQHVCCVIDSREPHFESCWQKYFADGVRYLFSGDNTVTFPPDTPER